MTGSLIAIDFDIRIDCVVCRRADAATRAQRGEVAFNRCSAFKAPAYCSLPNPVFDKQSGQALGIMIIVAQLAIPRLESPYGFDIFQNLKPFFG